MGVILLSVSKGGSEDYMNQLVAQNTMIMMMVIIIIRPPDNQCVRTASTHTYEGSMSGSWSLRLCLVQSLSHQHVILLNGGDK